MTTLAAPACAAAAQDRTDAAKPAANANFNTGVARARDALDSATSTSTVTEADIAKVAPQSLADVARLIPGIRAEAGSGVGSNSFTVRGLPLVSDGAKYIQLQENGLPVLEFGDVLGLGPDNFMRVDGTLAGVQAIRGGSASTFASNAPGGIINLIEKTGDTEGGSVQLSAGLDNELYRVDAEYGAHIDANTRFHIGGFYRAGEGPRAAGFSAYKGGQIKFNLTRDFTGGYFRIYVKTLDDHVPVYSNVPLLVSGTEAKPVYSDPAGFSATSDSLYSRYISNLAYLDSNNSLRQLDMHDGNHLKSTAIGFETKFDVGEWSVTDRFRHATASGSMSGMTPVQVLPATVLAGAFGGNTLSYVNGPTPGVIANPAALNGNGLLALTLVSHFTVNDLANTTNDIRASRVWNTGGGELTATAGFYYADQKLNFDWSYNTFIQDIAGQGNSALVDVSVSGFPITHGGVLALGVPSGSGYKRSYAVDYGVRAPYASLNYHQGRLAIGGSLRYDYGRVRGTVQADGPANQGFYDLTGDGVPDTMATFSPTGPRSPVHYNYNYLSYSVSANFRLAEAYSVFARYSRGARAGADRILFSPAISPTTGALLDSRAAYDPVRQLEAGFKLRTSSVTANLTGFIANVDETNTQLNTNSSGAQQLELVSRSYRAYGAEFEASWRYGAFSLNGGATLTHAEITKDPSHPDYVGHTPRHQAAFIYQVMPQFDQGMFTVGASIVGTTGSFTQDVNRLRLPAYTTVGAFVQVRPVDRVTVSLTARNLFDVRAITDVVDNSMPVTGITTGKVLNGRTVQASLRFEF